MAVINNYVNSDIQSDKLTDAISISGDKICVVSTTFEVAAADDDGSIYRVAKLPANAVLIEARIFNDAITAATDYDLGLYDALSDGGVVVDADLFADGVDISSGNAVSAGGATLLGALSPEDLVTKVYEHAGATVITKKEGYDLALTANTVGTAAGTITMVIRFVQG